MGMPVDVYNAISKDTAMITLKLISFLEIINGKRYSIVTVDTDSEWDAEINGPEPGYATFVAFLSDLVMHESVDSPVRAVFAERRAKNPLYTIHTADDVKKLLGADHRPNEWFFIDIGNPFPKKICEYEPYYKFLQYKDFDLKIFQDSYLVIYHEVDILYAELISTQLNPDIMKKVLSEIARDRFSSALRIINS